MHLCWITREDAIDTPSLSSSIKQTGISTKSGVGKRGHQRPVPSRRFPFESLSLSVVPLLLLAHSRASSAAETHPFRKSRTLARRGRTRNIGGLHAISHYFKIIKSFPFHELETDVNTWAAVRRKETSEIRKQNKRFKTLLGSF
jgi:hypothetical protein